MRFESNPTPDSSNPSKLSREDWLARHRLWILRLSFAVGFLLILAGCSAWLAQVLPDGETQIPLESTATAAPSEVAATPTFKPLPTSSGPMALPIWVPPQFDPASNSPAGNLLQERLNAYMEAHPDVVVEVRVKSSSGPGSLLEALTSTNAAAPAAVPGLIALNRSDLEAAAIKGLIYPLDGLSTAMDDSDWFPYARQLASLQDSLFGLPFAGDALVLLYRPSAIGDQPLDTWADLLGRGVPLIFQAGDQQAMLTLALYLSAGGSVQDAQGRPSLDANILAKVFEVYQKGAHNGIFPASIAQYQSPGQAWQAFQEGQADWVITWSSNYLGELPADTNAALLPPVDTKSLTTANGWIWALSDPDPVRREASIALAEFLVQPDFMAEWSAAAGYLPTRPTALEGWSNESLQPLFYQVALSAQVRPANELMASLGPVLMEGTLSVIKGQATPIQAARLAAQKLGAPE